MTFRCFIFCCIFLGIGTAHRPVAAKEVVFKFSGIVDYVYPICEEIFTPSKEISGEYRFETRTNDEGSGDPNYAFYLGAIISLKVFIGNYYINQVNIFLEYGIDYENHISYSNNYHSGSGIIDLYEVCSAWTGEQLDCIEENFPQSFYIRLEKDLPPLDALADIGLSPIPPSLPKFTYNRWALIGTSQGKGEGIVSGRLLSLTTEIRPINPNVGSILQPLLLSD